MSFINNVSHIENIQYLNFKDLHAILAASKLKIRFNALTFETRQIAAKISLSGYYIRLQIFNLNCYIFLSFCPRRLYQITAKKPCQCFVLIIHSASRNNFVLHQGEYPLVNQV